MQSMPNLALGLKEWIDNVIVPALVREYIDEMQKQNNLAFTDHCPVVSVSELRASALTRELR